MQNPKECCSICTEYFTKNIKKKITCTNPECNESTCLLCFKKYIFDTSRDIPQCMYCKVEFVNDYLYKVLPKKIINEILNHRAQMYCSREKSLLPSTQGDVIIYKEQLRINNLITDILKRNYDLKKEIKKNLQTIRELRVNGNYSTSNKNPENFIFHQKCPNFECKGFLSSSWKCMLCEKYFCKDCHNQKNGREDNNHSCDLELKKTIAMISKETKLCPNCTVPIHKLYGCSQMYCTQCHTPFCWNTGKIIKGIIHNPHFFEYQRNTERIMRQPGDLPCGGLPTFYELQNAVKNLANASKFSSEKNHTYFVRKNINYLSNIIRIIYHMNDVMVTFYNYNENPDNLRHLRIQFLLNNMTEKEWIIKLKAKMKKNDKNREINFIFDMLSHCVTDILQRFVNKPIFDDINELHKLREYVNDQLENISTKYNNNTPCIKENWEYFE